MEAKQEHSDNFKDHTDNRANSEVNVDSHLIMKTNAQTSSTNGAKMLHENSSEDIDANLKLLGVNIQDQEELEANIMKKIDESIKEKERDVTIKQVKKELLPIVDSLRVLHKTRRKCEKELNILSNSSSTINSQQQRKISSLISDQEELSKLIFKNYTKQKTLLQKLTLCNYSYENDPEIQPFNILQEYIENENKTVILEEKKMQETQLEKSIRLGEVTAFGTSLQSTSKTTEVESFDNYLQDQICKQGGQSKRKYDNGSGSESDSGFVEVESGGKIQMSKEHHALRKGKKRLRREALEYEINGEKIDKVKGPDQEAEGMSGLYSEEPENDEEWKPDDETDDNDNEPLIKKQKPKIKGRLRKISESSDDGWWRTDDSDWEGTDDEATTTKRYRGKKTRSGSLAVRTSILFFRCPIHIPVSHYPYIVSFQCSP